MKKRNLILASVVLLPTIPMVAGCAIADAIKCSGKEKIKIFNWGNYIDTDVIKGFEKEEDVCVSYSKFDSNEIAIAKMSTSVYDVIFPSDYAIEQLALEDKILELDWSRITTFNKETDIVPDLSNMLENMKNNGPSFDLLKYAAPYMMGYVGILYNNTKITETEIEQQGWEILRNNKYRVAYYDSARDGFVPPLSQLGYSINTSNKTEIDLATEWLKQQKNNLGNKIVYLTDEVLDDMVSQRYDIALVYSGDALYIMNQQPNMSFYRPLDKSTNVFVDGMVIQKQSKKVDLAYKFINYILNFENSLANSRYIGYTSTRHDVYKYLSENDYSDYSDVYAFDILPQDEMFRYSETTRELMNSAWTLLRS